MVAVYEKEYDPRHFLQAAYGCLQEVVWVVVYVALVDLHAKRSTVTLSTKAALTASHPLSAL